MASNESLALEQSKAFKLLNRGLIQSVESGSLPEGALTRASNVSATQEGAITPRFGSASLFTGGGMGVVHSASKLALGTDAADLRYLGDGSIIYRMTGPYVSLTNVTSGYPLSTQRWQAVPYKSGTSGSPNIFFAHPTVMMRDDGSYGTLRPWGILPPTRPAYAVPADPSLTNFPALKVLTAHGGGTDRLSTSVSSSVVVAGSYYKITPGSMSDILPGMLVTIGGVNTIVDAVEPTAFYAYCSAPPGGAITSLYKQVTGAVIPADGNTYSETFAATVDWSFRGRPEDGYDSDDSVHASLYVSDLTKIKELRVRINVGPGSSDYYEKAVAVPQIQSFVTGVDTAVETQSTRADLLIAGALGQVGFPDEFSGQLQPFELPPAAAAQWVEFDVPKRDFVAVGNAGRGPNSWKNVTGVTVVVITNAVAASPTFTIRLGPVYGFGGQGPNSFATPAAEPYSYAYVYRDPSTGAIGNPCPVMMPEHYVDVKNRAIAVTVHGASTAAVSGNPAITGFGSIVIYRAGGVFADRVYRRVGYEANPGDGNTVTFVDNLTDEDIEGSPTIEFDNYPPVLADLPVPFVGKIATISGSAHSLATLTFSNYPGGALTQYFSVGAQVTIGAGTNREEAIVEVVGAGSIQVWIQRTHYVGEEVSCSTWVGSPCDIAIKAGDSIIVAGDSRNPHKIYRSKAGRPTSFPVINLATQSSHQVNVSSPDNPIHGLEEIGGEYVALAKTSLYVFQAWGGNITEPKRVRGSVGCVIKHAYCKVGDGVIWYLGYDGIYRWGGGPSEKVSDEVNWLFNKTVVEGRQPLDYDQPVFMAHYGRFVWILYKDILGENAGIRYDLVNKRWEPILYKTASTPGALTSLLPEYDSKRMVGFVFDNTLGRTVLRALDSGTSDGGTAIEWNCRLGSLSIGPRTTKVILTSIGVELENPSDNVTLNLFYDDSGTVDPKDQFVIPPGGRRVVPLPLQITSSTTFGKECRTFIPEFSGNTTGSVKLFEMTAYFQPLEDPQRGNVLTWRNLGHKWDKRLSVVTVMFNTHGVTQQVFIDTVSGIEQGTVTNGAHNIILPAVTERAEMQFPLPDGMIAKLVRLRPAVTAQDVDIFNWDMLFEPYPPDIVPFTEYTDSGYPLDKYLQEVVFDVDTNGQNVTVAIDVDGNPATQTVTVNATQGDRKKQITINPSIRGRMIRVRPVTIPAGGKFQLFNVQFGVVPADLGPVKHTGDWTDEGHPYDKRLQHLIIDYENSGGTVQIAVDVVRGLGGGSVVLADFTVTLTAVGRAKHTFAVTDGKIAKLMRVRPVNANPANFKMWSASFKFEAMPPDVISHTPWNDFGEPHEKYIQEIVFDVDTGGVEATVIIESEDGTEQTVAVTSTESDRTKIVTLNPRLEGKKFRLKPTPGNGGKFQMWDWRPKFLRANPGAIEASYDFDDLGWPYDKKLKTVTFHYDSNGTPVTMYVDTVTGINGDTVTIAPTAPAMSFVLTGSGRALQTFAVPDGRIVKMVRVYPATTHPDFKIWKYVFDKDNYPPDKISATEWEDLGWKCDKLVRNVTLEVDTGGVAVTVQIEMDGQPVGSPFHVTSTNIDRTRVITPESDLVGRLFRLVPTIPAGGKFQLFDKKWDFIREPCPATHWDSYDTSFGKVGWKIIKQMWVQYVCDGQIRIRIYRDGFELFFEKILPPHDKRDVENFLFPDRNEVLAWKPLNKSRQYRIQVDAMETDKPYKFYMDGSRIETMNLSDDQRAAYAQHVFWQNMQIQV